MSRLNVDRTLLHQAFDMVSASGFLTEGAYVRMFEEQVSEWCGLHAVAVSSAGAGLFTMLRCLDLRDQENAIVSNNTFFATGAMAKEAGFKVRLADCSMTDFCLEPGWLEAHAPPWTRVVILTHIGGGLCKNYARIAGWCKRNGVILLEDAAHALCAGGIINGVRKHAGMYGEAAVFSLYPTKAVPAGEGGVIVTSNAEYADKMRAFRNYGKFKLPSGQLAYKGEGFNFRMDEWTAAVAYLQMMRRREIIERREEAAYKLSKVVEPMIKWGPDESNWYKFIVPADFPAKRKTGKVFEFSDQLSQSMRMPGYFQSALWVSDHHICLPIEEGLYDGKSTGEIEQWLLEK